MMVLHNSNLITSNLVTNFILLWFNKYNTKSYKLRTSLDQIQYVPTRLLVHHSVQEPFKPLEWRQLRTYP